MRRAPAARPAQPAPTVVAAARPAATAEAFSPSPVADPPTATATLAKPPAAPPPVATAQTFPAADVETLRPDTSDAAPGPTLAAPAFEPSHPFADAPPAPPGLPDGRTVAAAVASPATKEIVAVVSLPPVPPPIAAPTAARDPASPTPIQRAEAMGPRIHIGHVEVRTSPPPAPLPPIAPPPIHLAAQPPAAPAPVSRSYGWRYGLSQS